MIDSKRCSPAVNSFALLTLSFCMFVLLVITHEHREDSRIIPRLLKPPSVIVAPPPKFCQGFRYLVAVYTRVNESEIRLRFRQRYGPFSSKYNFTVVFPLGISDAKTNEAVLHEHHRFGDVLQTNFYDSYRNLTLKSFSFSHFVDKNCTNVRAVLKIDDDVEWNVRKVIDEMDAIDFTAKRLYCQFGNNTTPIRTTSKWFISVEEYPHELFPPYCAGVAYFATPSTFVTLFHATSTVPHIWLDDVFSTGIVGAAACVSFTRLRFINRKKYAEISPEMEIIYNVKEDGDRSLIFNIFNGNLSTTSENLTSSFVAY